VEDAGDGSSTNHVVKKISIDIRGGKNRFTTRGRAILGDALASTCAAGVIPIILFLGNIRVIGFLGANADDTVFEP